MSAALNRPMRNMPRRKQQRVLRMPTMPLDVVAVILAYLPRADMRRASTASRIFYEAAHIAGLELHVNLETLNADSLMNFTLVFRHALAHRVQFKLALALLVVWREAERADFQSSLLDTLAAIRSAMPRLASLRATFAGHFAEAVYGGLSEAARARVLADRRAARPDPTNAVRRPGAPPPRARARHPHAQTGVASRSGPRPRPRSDHSAGPRRPAFRAPAVLPRPARAHFRLEAVQT
ncbi:hypothetical protein AURDEDRAFT_113477 [Auricularia subglabra TFB-10046 SS5]|nr:hypothetical protein AURDEDRAFT_113477 [Auricularia subglabra TFB-10046 SS5]